MEVGIDIVKIDRIEKIENIDGFLNKYFTPNEIKYINSKHNMFETVAGLYACKEAILKSLKIGIGNGINLKELEISHDSNNAPIVEIDAKLMSFLIKVNANEIKVSISHDGDYAIAIANVF